ncbi:MAG: S-ribosylhomocysteine lyase [Clostridia bacterium]|nr:S-ribosylhomocysteine lyase [Clostridia bacterium]
MEKIPSFQKNHDTLETGLHAQTDKNGVTTFDLRFKKPNGGDYITPKALHTIEHLMATVLRNSAQKNNIVYFGPMGCRTGFYLLTLRITYAEVIELLKESIAKALALDEIPGSKREECGNYLEHDLEGAKEELRKYLEILERI